MKLLFITRKYPPMVGGMEKVSYALAQEFSKRVDTTVISWGRSQKFLPLFLTWALLKAILFIPLKGITHVHLGDALLAPLGFVLKLLYGVKVSVTVHGLDITYKLPIYQLIIPFFVSKMDKVICVSSATLEECVNRGLNRERCVVIPWGIDPVDYIVEAEKQDLERIIGKNITDKKVYITVGRLVQRKGVYWFIEKVLPNLQGNFIYLIIGDGPERKNIEKLIENSPVRDRILMLGKVEDNHLKIIYNTADLFVMPNIIIDGDMEGFGLVALEAASTGTTVVASDIEGVKDVICREAMGKLVQANNVNVWVEVVNTLEVKDRETVRQTVKEAFSWDKVGNSYSNIIDEH